MGLDKFEGYCKKCGADQPDCDKAFNAIYEEVKKEVSDEVIRYGLDSILRNCGDKNCGTAIHDYMQLKRYDDSR